MQEKFREPLFGSGVDFRESTTRIQEVKDLFKARLLKEDRERLWARYERIRYDINGRKHKAYEDRIKDSRWKRDFISPILDGALNLAGVARTNDEFSKVKAMLADALARMKPGWDGFDTMSQAFASRPGRLTKEDNDYLWAKYQQAQAALHARREFLHGVNYNELLSEASAAASAAVHAERLRDASDRLKAVQAKLRDTPMGKLQREDVRRVIQNGFDALAARAAEFAREKERRSQEWRMRQLAGIEKLEGARAKTEAYRGNLVRQISDLQAKVAGAWSDDFRARHQGWLNEKMSKLAEVERSLADLDRRLADARSRL